MNATRQTLPILSILDAKVITGPVRGLIHLARHLPPGAWLHIALLRSNRDEPLPPIEAAARGAPLTVHPIYESSSYDPTVILRTRDLAREIGARLIQSHSYKPHVIAMGVRALTGIPWIGFHHGWTAESLKMKAFHALDRVTMPRANHCVAVSTHSEQLLLGVGCPRKTTTMITNAVDPADLVSDQTRDEARAGFKLPADALVAVAVGRLSNEKGQDVLLRAFAKMASQVPSLVVALAGDGPDRNDLEALARELGIAERTHFLGHQPNVARVHAAADILVLPSRSEGMPNALLEAMCLGTSAIATDVGGVREVAKDPATAWIVPSDRPDLLASALSKCALDPVERARRAANAKAHVTATMSPARRTERFMDLYRNVLGLESSAFATEPAAASADVGRAALAGQGGV